MSLIQINNLIFSYPGSYDAVFENVTLQLDTNWRLGLVGRNGRGKTTLLNLLLGNYEFTGTISASVRFAYFPYSVENPQENTIELLHSLCPECQDWEFYRELSLLETEDDIFYRPFSTLSNGERTKVLLAALFLHENCFLLIDEPTNHLDTGAREAIGAYLKKKQGFILVSHDRNLLDHCVDHILSLNKTDIEVQNGNFSSWWYQKECRDRAELEQNEHLKKEISRLSVAAKRTSGWSEQVEKTKYATKNSGVKPDRGYIGHKSAKMMKHAKTIESRQQEAIAEKSGLLKKLESAESLKLFPIPYHSKRLLEISHLALCYGEKAVCSEVSFQLMQGDRIALCGKNGSGKSSILKLICGEPISYGGIFFKGSGLKISYVPQDASFLQGNLSDYAAGLGIDETRLKTILRKLDFQCIQFEKDMASFSSGQKKKVLLASSLCEQAHLYIWDEPLNYIDIFSRIQIEKLILQYKPTLLFVEHDSAFGNHIATRMITL